MFMNLKIYRVHIEKKTILVHVNKDPKNYQDRGDLYWITHDGINISGVGVVEKMEIDTQVANRLISEATLFIDFFNEYTKMVLCYQDVFDLTEQK